MERSTRAMRVIGDVLVGVILLMAIGACSRASERQAPISDLGPPQVTKVGDTGCTECPDSRGLAPRALVLAGNEVWLLDSSEPYVRVFDLAGDELGAFGRTGEGPGELNLPAWLGRTEAGEALIYNSLPPRLMRFDSAQGEVLGTTRLTSRVPMNITFHAGSQALYRLSFMFGDTNERLDRIDIVSGQSTALLPEPEDHPSLPGTEDGPLMRRRFPITALRDGGFAVGDAWNYVIRNYDRDGRLGGTITRALPRPSARGLEIDGFEPGAALPHFGKFALDYDSAHDILWVMTYRGVSSEATVFDLFEAGGAFIGSLTLPTMTSLEFKSFDVEGDYLASWSESPQQGGVLTIWRLQWADREP